MTASVTSSLEVVIFDLGNVLIEWDRRNLFAKLIPDPDELDHFLDNVLTMDVNARLDAGMAIHDVASEVAEQHPDRRELIMAYATRWKETLGSVIDGTVEILDELSRSGVMLLALSNWGKDTFASIEKEYPFFELFDGMVISGREGVVKPDRAIFDLLCEKYDVTPAQSVFIDDSDANIAAATILGFDALLFESPERLRQQLTYRDLL